MASISQEERATIIANNKSLRIIKNEMDQLLERGGITDEQYENLIGSLPAERSLRNVSTPVPANNSSSTSIGNFGALSISDRTNSIPPAPQADAPPAYKNPTPPPPPQNQGPPELCRVVSLYRYVNPDPRDLDFETGDQISVTSYANNEWWSGKNLRTGQVGIFPANYVRVEANPTSYYGSNEKEKQQGGYYGAQGQTASNPNPYSSPVPPMAIANQPEPQQQPVEGAKPNKAGEMGKKFGKKLGNAAIFGAGATLGADLVNSIF